MKFWSYIECEYFCQCLLYVYLNGFFQYIIDYKNLNSGNMIGLSLYLYFYGTLQWLIFIWMLYDSEMWYCTSYCGYMFI